MESDIQEKIFQHVKGAMLPQASLADELAALLNISTDSAYRRIRGDKSLSLEELYAISKHFKLSLDSLFELNTNSFCFTGDFVNTGTFQFEAYLANVVQHVKYMNSFENKEMIYMCKDIPLFHHFHFRELAAFKHYFWMKNILHLPEFAQKKFSISDYPDHFFELGRKALDYYNQLSSIEVWNIESINSTIRQVEFYKESNVFSSSEDMLMLYEALEKLLGHLEEQATLGYKFDPLTGPSEPLGSYQMYFNEIVILENSILVNLDGSRAAFLVHNVLNYMITRDVRFCENMNRYVQNTLRKSTLISTVSERERARFFKYLRNRIKNRKQNIKV
jgi:hypothetical protein